MAKETSANVEPLQQTLADDQAANCESKTKITLNTNIYRPDDTKHLLLVREVQDSNPEPIKYPTRCQPLATAVAFKRGPWRKRALHSAHCSLATPERVLSEYNEDLI